MELNVANCPQCGKLFQKGIRNICPNCFKEVEKKYELCAQYIRENRHTTIGDVSEATDVSVRLITRFIREGRISLGSLPNMSYPCESCGDPIRTGHLCVSCKNRLQKDINTVTSTHASSEDERRRRAGYEIKGKLE